MRIQQLCKSETFIISTWMVQQSSHPQYVCWQDVCWSGDLSVTFITVLALFSVSFWCHLQTRIPHDSRINWRSCPLKTALRVGENIILFVEKEPSVIRAISKLHSAFQIFIGIVFLIYTCFYLCSSATSLNEAGCIISEIGRSNLILVWSSSWQDDGVIH